MCSSPSVPDAKPLEPAKAAQPSMDKASDASIRAQMMRRGIYSTFADSRGYSSALQSTTPDAASTATGAADTSVVPATGFTPTRRSATLG